MDKTAEQSSRDGEWLVKQLRAWPERVDMGKTTSITYLIQTAADEIDRLAALSARPAVGEDVAERVQDMLVAAYEAGATAVHNSWVEGTNGSEPDFYEAASDYAHAAIAAITGENNG